MLFKELVLFFLKALHFRFLRFDFFSHGHIYVYRKRLLRFFFFYSYNYLGYPAFYRFDFLCIDEQAPRTLKRLIALSLRKTY